jgi:VanZ family protein
MMKNFRTWALALRLDHRICRVLALVWMALIFFLSSKSSLPVQSLFPLQDKIEHGIVFGILALFFYGSFKHRLAPSVLKRILVTTAMVAAYGAFDEFHQAFVPARDASLSDLAADVVGGLLFAIICSVYARTGDVAARNSKIRE